MALYLLHWDEPLVGGQSPRHYLGWAKDEQVEERIRTHLTGGVRAAKIVTAARAAGREVRVAWVRLGDRTDESRLKRQKRGYARLCPLCREEVSRNAST